jgi:hypothetical protein
MAHIVAELAGNSVDNNPFVPSIRQVLLERSIGTVRVTDEHPQLAVNKFIQF